MATEKSNTPSTTTTPKASTPRQATSSQRSNPAGGLAAELQADHERRVTVPGAPNVDARLDNRTGDDRPPVESWPAKPQQVDGPDVMGQVEHTRRVLADRDRDKDTVERKGMFSPGPHGLSDESLRDGPTTFGTEGLTEAEAAKGSPTAG
ncbi:hypothetical protein ACWCHM_26120 [Micromonospora sp. SCSIO 07396]